MKDPILALSREGHPPEAIAAMLQKPLKEVKDKLIAHGHIPRYTEQEAAEIARAYQNGASIRFLADLFELTRPAVDKILRHYRIPIRDGATPTPPPTRVKAARRAIRVLPDETKKQIEAMRGRKMSKARIAQAVGISPVTLQQYLDDTAPPAATRPVRRKSPATQPVRKRLLSNLELGRVIRLRQQGEPDHVIARKLDLPTALINAIPRDL